MLGMFRSMVQHSFESNILTNKCMGATAVCLHVHFACLVAVGFACC